MLTLGQRIRRLRNRQRQTLQQIAESCGFTRSLLSKIENDKTIPPVSTLMRIAEALGVKASVLLDEGEEISCAYTGKDKLTETGFVMTDKGYGFFTFAPQYSRKIMQPFMFVAKKGDVLKHSLNHSGEEFIYMLEGEMEYRVGDITYTLREGDSLYFDAEENHELSPITEEVRYLGIFAESQGDQK
ncbi:MAG: helix-turn-helix transcriptional regulator [Planctomycetes bacterium]|nr:helix-turn-helix transcriptional regulator [Planctomycetota bacterium]